MRPAAATATADAVRAGEATATSVVESALDAIGDDPLNAFTEIDHEGALRRAAIVDQMVRSGTDPGSMAGVPVALKDLIDHVGHVTTAGSSFYRHRPKRNAACVERLEAAGAVIVGRTGLHEFAFGFSSENEHFGPVRNPWDPRTSPGGSSGGSAVAVAAGWTPVAIGTDTGGSVRVPAALCGIYGLKVTHGRIPLSGVFPLAPSADTVGPLARTIPDLRLALDAMTGLDPGDPWSRSGTLSGDTTRIGVPAQWIAKAPLADPVADSFETVVGDITAEGFEVLAVDEGGLVPNQMIDDMAYGEVAPIHRAWWHEHPSRYGHEVAERMHRVFEVTLDRHVAAHRWRAGLRGLVERIFDRVDVLVTPATCVTAKTIGQNTVPTRDGDVDYRRALAWFTALVNHMGCPAVVGPVAATGAPPPGLQIIAPWWGEERLLRFAQLLEDRGILAGSITDSAGDTG